MITGDKALLECDTRKQRSAGNKLYNIGSTTHTVNLVSLRPTPLDDQHVLET